MSAFTSFPKPIHTPLRGTSLLHDPLLNKGLAFPTAERDRLGLRGLLPAGYESIEHQEQRVIQELQDLPDNMAKNFYLQELQNCNETLFLKVLADHIEELAPIVYTPTVALACMQFSVRFKRPRGLFLSIADAGNLHWILRYWKHDDVQVIVVTDGSRILGMGDQGIHGMAIPIGKLALYCAIGGIAPDKVLPITLDVGTDNTALLNDRNYIGLRSQRVNDDAYYRFFDEFMHAVRDRWPHCLVQFEDFATKKAIPILLRYRNAFHCFDDDIQGTGCVVVAGILAAAKFRGCNIRNQRYLCVGIGSGGIGVCERLLHFYCDEGETEEQAKARIVVCSSKGALGRPDGKHGNPNVGSMSRERSVWVSECVSDGASPLEVIREFNPTVLIGLSGNAGTFTFDMIQEMSNYCNPIILPLSNPGRNSECTAQDAVDWSHGNAIVATGSPFSPVWLPNGKTKVVSQCNNMYIYPGIGLAAVLGDLNVISEGMLTEASRGCASVLAPEEAEEGRLFPSLKRIREVSKNVAAYVLRRALREGSANNLRSMNITEPQVLEFVERNMYTPSYVPIV